MAVPHGKHTEVLIDEYDLSGWLSSASISHVLGTHETPRFGLNSMRRIVGYGEGSLDYAGFWETDALNPDIVDIIEAILGSDVGQLFTVSITAVPAVGDRCHLIKVKKGDYEIESGDDATRVSGSAQSDGDVESGPLLHPLGAETATANGASVDLTSAAQGSSTATRPSGAVGHLHVTAASGTTPTLDVIIQHSTDNATWVDLITFTQVTAAGKERIEVTGTVNRYVRAIYTIGGTGPSFTFAVAFARR